jgi:hypothetical protein
VHAVTTATAGLPVAIVTVGKPLADAGTSNHSLQRKRIYLSAFFTALFTDGILEWIFFVEVSGHKLESPYSRAFVWLCTVVLPFYKMLFMNRFEFSCFAFF